MINTLYPPHQIGGAEKSVALLSEALVKGGDDVSVISLHPEPEQIVTERNGVRVHRLPIDNIYWTLGRKEKKNWLLRLVWHYNDNWNMKAAARVARLMDAERPDIVHTNTVSGLSVAIWEEARRRGLPIVHTLRDYYLVCSRYSLFRNGRCCATQCLDCKIMTHSRKSASVAVNLLVSNSAFLLEAHHKHNYFPDIPSRVIYNIADTLETLPARPDSDGDLVFGFIGRVEQEKGIEVVLEALRHLRRSNWKLKIAGSGITAYIQNLKRKHPDPRIEWLGFVKSNDFYKAIDVSLIASIWPEPLPRTLIETFAAGRSAICALSGGTGEIAGMGVRSSTYPANEPLALAGKMDDAIANRTLWRQGGFRDASAKNSFSEAVIRGHYRNAYLQVLSTAPSLENA
jgi:glycosyltransferase involved in cell wall biosynthesis